MSCLEDDFLWTPLSEGELKVLEAKRERNNKISSLMGQYLLRGYKMLATSCSACEVCKQCVLLEDRQKQLYCIGCSEVDADTKKDNPAVNQEAARRAVNELQHRQNSDSAISITSQVQSSASPSDTNVSFLVDRTTIMSRQPREKRKRIVVHDTDVDKDVSMAIVAIRDKLALATKQLNAATSAEEALPWAALVTECSKALAALRELTVT